MRQEEIWDADAARKYDTPGTGMSAPEVLEPAVERLAELAGQGRASWAFLIVPQADPIYGYKCTPSRPLVEGARALRPDLAALSRDGEE